MLIVCSYNFVNTNLNVLTGRESYKKEKKMFVAFLAKQRLQCKMSFFLMQIRVRLYSNMA